MNGLLWQYLGCSFLPVMFPEASCRYALSIVRRLFAHLLDDVR